MKVVILAGGRGTASHEETIVRPKPMVEIGGRPLLWHVMQLYSLARLQGFSGGLRVSRRDGIKEYLRNLSLRTSDYVAWTWRDGSVEIIKKSDLDWKVGATTPASRRRQQAASFD